MPATTTDYTILGATVIADYNGRPVPPRLYVYHAGTIPFDYTNYDEVDGHYVSVMPDGRVHHIYKRDPDTPDKGFCGATFTADMCDGSVRTWQGGWDTALPADSPLTPFIQIVWVRGATGRCGIIGRLTTDKARELLERYCPGYEIIQEEYGHALQPLPSSVNTLSVEELTRAQTVAPDFVFAASGARSSDVIEVKTHTPALRTITRETLRDQIYGIIENGRQRDTSPWADADEILGLLAPQ